MLKQKSLFYLLFLLIVMVPLARSATITPGRTTITPGRNRNQWIAYGQLNDQIPVAVFQITTDSVSSFQMYANITSNITSNDDLDDDLDTLLALYDSDNNFIKYGDDSGDSLNPILYSLLPKNQTYILKFGTYDGFNFDTNQFGLLSKRDPTNTPYDYRLAFVNIASVVDQTPAPVPVPTAILLFGSGIIGLFGLKRSRKMFKNN